MGGKLSDIFNRVILMRGGGGGGGPSGPVNTVAPVVSGTPEVGETLSCTEGTWTGEGTITYAYQWRRNGVNISGATSSTYELVEADEDAMISCRVTATDDEGSRSRVSNAVGPVIGDGPVFYYLRPDGESGYFRPDGVSIYEVA